MTRSHRIEALIIAALMLTFVFQAGCGKDANPLAPDRSIETLSPLPIGGTDGQPVLGCDSEKRETSQWVSAEWGGTVALEFCMVVIPPQALEDDTVISIARDDQHSATVDLGPDGLQFNEAVTIRFDLEPFEAYMEEHDIAPEDLVIALYDEDAGEWVALETTVDDDLDDDGFEDSISAETYHFSRYALAE